MLNLSRANLLTLGYAAAVFLLVLAAFFVPRDTQFELAIPVDKPLDHVLRILDNITKMAATLNTAFVGVAVGFALKSDSFGVKKRPFDMAVVLLILLAGAISYFGIYLLYTRLLSMLAAVDLKAIDVMEAQVIWAIRFQFWGVVFQAVCLGLLVSRILDRLRNADQQSARGSQT